MWTLLPAGSFSHQAGRDRLSRTTRLAGAALIAGGAALCAVSFRMAARDRVAAEAAAHAAAVASVATENEARAAEDLSAIESRVRTAAALAPLVAAVKMNVDADTFNDLFDSEEWWRRYREDFSFVRLIVNGNVVATRGTADIGSLDKPVVKLARRQGTASATVIIGRQPYLLAASRLALSPDPPPI